MDDERLNKLVDELHLLNPLFRKTILQRRKFWNNKKLPPSNYMILGILKKRGAIPMSEIGRKICISKSNMTSLIDKLVEEGLVEQSPDTSDRRVINIAITEKGYEQLRGWRKHQNKEIREKLSILSDEDLEKLYDSMENIKKILYKIRDN